MSFGLRSSFSACAGKSAISLNATRTGAVVCRSGKTSIRQVLFNDLSPRETLYLETTTHLTKHTFECVPPAQRFVLLS